MNILTKLEPEYFLFSYIEHFKVEILWFTDSDECKYFSLRFLWNYVSVLK